MKYLWLPVMAAMIIAFVMGCQGGPQVTFTAGAPGIATANITLSVTQPQDESIVRTNPVTVSGSVPAEIEVMVNGISVNLENNRFSAMVELETGPNIIEVLARDKSGRETSKSINIIYVP